MFSSIIIIIIINIFILSWTTDSRDKMSFLQDDYIRQEGYPVERHTVITSDGYNLTLHRIPYSKTEDPSAVTRKPAVLVQHGILCSSTDWVIAGQNNSLGEWRWRLHDRLYVGGYNIMSATTTRRAAHTEFADVGTRRFLWSVIISTQNRPPACNHLSIHSRKDSIRLGPGHFFFYKCVEMNENSITTEFHGVLLSTFSGPSHWS